MFSLRFDQPHLLWLGLVAVPLLIIGWRSLALTDHLRRAVILGLRAILLLALVILLAGPHVQREHDHLTVIGLLDISGSVKRFGGVELNLKTPGLTNDSEKDADRLDAFALTPEVAGATSGRPGDSPSIFEYLRDWFRIATNLKTPDDRFGLIVFDGKAIAISAPTKTKYVDDNLDTPIAQGTNIEDAVRLGLAMFPPDTAKRLVLVTDGNETAGNVMQAIERMGGAGDLRLTIDDVRLGGRGVQSSIPIDVLPIAYRVTRDVQVVRVEAPPTAQAGQTVTVRIVLESTAPVEGTLTLRREGEPVDLNGDAPGASRAVSLPAGQSVHLAQVPLGETPINRFQAIFEADDPTHNLVPDNDRAEAFTATPSKGSALVIDARAGQRLNALAEMLISADIPTSVISAAQLPDDLLSLQNYDLIVLDNIASYELTPLQQQLLARYVNDLGGGLIMSGGENSFGAGGWRGSPIAALLPVDVDPPRELRLPTAALVLVLDKSGSMNQGVAGARASQQQIANEGAALAIESLRSDNLVGVVTFDMFASTLVPLQRNEDPKKIADKVRGITAEGGTNLEPALLRAHEMLTSPAAQGVLKKRVVFLTDGRSGTNEGLEDIARRMAADDIQLTTVAVGDDADYEILENLASVGGGSFYPVRDPRILPRVLVDSVQVINKPLIKEATFTPRVLATGSTLTAGMDGAPPLQGLVITSARKDPKVWLEMVDPEGEPLLAHWQTGLGRVAAFTSEAPGSGEWSRQWIDWPTAATFWIQLARTIARPVTDQNAELIAVIQDDELKITYDIEAGGESPEQDAAISYVQVEGTVYQPDGSFSPVRLRQTAPGRFETAIPATLAGNYVVALNPRQGSRQLPPAIGGANRSTTIEFRRYQSNLALLEEIVERSGGRRLDIADPRGIDLFDREHMPPSVSSLPIWRSLLWWTLALLLLDVASRRIAWDSQLLSRALTRALARVKPARLRATEAAATLATLRRVSDDTAIRRSTSPIPNERRKLTSLSPPAVVTDDRERIDLYDEIDHDERRQQRRAAPVSRVPQQPMPDEQKVSAALDALLGRSKPPKSSTPSQQQASTPAEPSETTGNLLAAKRRAQERLKKDQDQH
jgi:Ca-activated chloride channel family protein